MQHSLLAGRIHLKHGSEVTTSPENGGPIKIAGFVKNHARFRASAIARPAVKGVQHAKISRSIDLEHGSAAVSAVATEVASAVRRAIEVAGFVAHQVRHRPSSIGAAGKKVQLRLLAGWAEFENHAASRAIATILKTPVKCGAVEVTRLISN